MAVKKAKTGEKKVEFNEFQYSGDTFEYSGRIYPPKDGKGKVIKSYGVSLTLNGVITCRGVKLVETSENYFLTFPQYKSGEDYKSYVFIDKKLNDEIDTLTDIIASKAPKSN